MYSLLDMFSQTYVMKFISSNFNFFSFNSCFRLCSHITLHTYQTTFCADMKGHPAQCKWWQHWTGNKLFTHLKHLTKAQCLYRLLNSWKSLDNCPAIFQTWKRYGKYRYLKSGITVKSLGVFSFQSYNECFVSDVGQILFSLAHSFAVHHEKRFILAFFKVSVDHDLFDNLESGKSRFLFWKKVWKKSWILDLKSVLTHQIIILTSEYLLPS